MVNFYFATAALFYIQLCVAFDLPRDGCRSELNINDSQYNVTHTYHVGDAYPTDAHYDVYGNLFFVESGRNEKGYYFNINVLKFKTAAPEIIQGMNTWDYKGDNFNEKVKPTDGGSLCSTVIKNLLMLLTVHSKIRNFSYFEGLPEGISYSIAVDKNEKKVYFGTGQGIYKYNYESHDATPVSSSTLKLDMIFVDKDSNKYVTENKDGVEELYLLDGEMNKIRFNSLEALNELAIDDKNNFYYIKEEKLYVLKSTLSSPICIGNVSYDGVAQIAIHNDNVFIASDDLMYFHENDTGNLKLVENAPDNITAIAFDVTGDFVLGVPGKLLKYKKNECHIRKPQVMKSN